MSSSEPSGENALVIETDAGRERAPVDVPRLPGSFDACNHDSTKTALKLLLTNTAAGVVIGRKGSNRDHIQKVSGTRLQLSGPNQCYPGTSERILLVAGTLKAICSAVWSILLKLSESTEESGPSAGSTMVRLMMPAGVIGAVIGKAGVTIRQISQLACVNVSISAQDLTQPVVDYYRVVTITSMASVAEVSDTFDSDTVGSFADLHTPEPEQQQQQQLQQQRRSGLPSSDGETSATVSGSANVVSSELASDCASVRSTSVLTSLFTATAMVLSQAVASPFYNTPWMMSLQAVDSQHPPKSGHPVSLQQPLKHSVKPMSGPASGPLPLHSAPSLQPSHGGTPSPALPAPLGMRGLAQQHQHQQYQQHQQHQQQQQQQQQGPGPRVGASEHWQPQWLMHRPSDSNEASVNAFQHAAGGYHPGFQQFGQYGQYAQGLGFWQAASVQQARGMQQQGYQSLSGLVPMHTDMNRAAFNAGNRFPAQPMQHSARQSAAGPTQQYGQKPANLSKPYDSHGAQQHTLRQAVPAADVDAGGPASGAVLEALSVHGPSTPVEAALIAEGTAPGADRDGALNLLAAASPPEDAVFFRDQQNRMATHIYIPKHLLEPVMGRRGGTISSLKQLLNVYVDTKPAPLPLSTALGSSCVRISGDDVVSVQLARSIVLHRLSVHEADPQRAAAESSTA